MKQSSLILLAALILSGCASKQKPIYYWGDYQAAVYQYYQQDKSSPQEQLASLQKTIEGAKAKNLPVPPGLHAQMGLIHSSMGNVNEAYNQFSIEKQLFPESAPFMDFLMSNKTKGAVK